jgi:hypothetical protein
MAINLPLIVRSMVTGLNSIIVTLLPSSAEASNRLISFMVSDIALSIGLTISYA